MIFINFVGQFDFEYDIQGIIRSFYPGEELKSVTGQKPAADMGEPYDYILICDFSDYHMEMTFCDREQVIERKSFEKIYLDGQYDRKETKDTLKRQLYDILSGYTHKELPWGTLSGIRPTKITSKMVEEGLSDEEIFHRMKRDYYLSDGKIKESTEISRTEHQILSNIEEGYSIYIGIPFCPSKCLYCSFTSNPVSAFQNRVDEYLDAMMKEMKFCAEAYKEKRLCTIYIGGGTPTALSAKQLDKLLGYVEEIFDTKHLYEYTIEAGRPDSITEEKLRIIKKYDITRISINPQTMKDDTLKLIGRNHTTAQFLESYELARKLGFDNINMDFILGLPNETIEDVRQSMEMVKQLKPDSLTIHSLAVKRAARLNFEQRMGKKYEIHNSEELMDVTIQTAQETGLRPYYLYRQKNMAGNLENVGYAKSGKEGIYNILIMEEKQTILAIGAGGSSKMVSDDCNVIERIENVKDVKTYIERIDDMIERKRKYIYGKDR